VLTGQLPFDADVERSVSRRASGDRPPPIDAPGGLARLCAGLLDPAPSGRLGVAEVVAALDPASAAQIAAARSTRLIARDEELTRLAGALEAACASSAPVVVRVSGGSGMGKSALLRAFAARLDGPRLLEARSYEGDAVPHKAIDAAVDELAARLRRSRVRGGARLDDEEASALAAIFPVLGEALGVERSGADGGRDPRERRRVAGRGLARLLRGWSDEAPGGGRGVVLLLDDVHWGDLDSARLLVDVLAAAPGPLLVVLAHRSEVESAFVGEVARWARDARCPIIDVPVAPLSSAAATELAALLGGAEHAERLAAQADGCPLVLEMLAESGARSEHDVDGVVKHRLASLPATARRALEAVCLAGRPVAQTRVALTAGEGHDAWRTWAALGRGRLIRSCGASAPPAVEPYHDRIRDAVTRAMSAGERAATHLRLGEAFAVAPADEEGAAVHLALGGAHERALGFARSAARAARAALAFDRAARFVELAISCCRPGDQALRDELEVELAHTLASGGRGAEAAPIFQRQAGRSRGVAAIDLRRAAMEQLLLAGRVDEGRDVMDAVLAAMGVWRPRAARAIEVVLLAELARLILRGPALAAPRPLAPAERLVLDTFQSIGKGMSSYDASLGTWFFLRAARRALDAGSYEHAVRGVAFTGSLLGFVGALAERHARRWITAGEGLAAAHHDDHGLAVCAVARGMIECCSGDWPRALATFDEAARVLRHHPASAWESNIARTTSLFVLAQLGAIEELSRRAANMSREGRERGDLALQVESDLYLALAALAADDPAAATACVERNLAAWTTRDYLFQSWIAIRFLTLARLYAGAWDEALAGIERALPRARAANLTAMQVVRIEAADLCGRATLAASLGATGRPRAALLAAAETHARSLARERCAHAHAPAAMLRAGIAERRGDRRRAVALLDQARRAYQRAAMRVHALAAAWHAARVDGRPEARGAIEEQLRASGIRAPARWATMHLAPVEPC
jgi:hypothetical protein